MHSIRDLLSQSTAFLEKRGVSSSRFCAEELLASVLQKRRLDLALKQDMPLDMKIVDAYRQLIERRGRKEPLGYLLGEVEFLSCSLTLNRDVFIPRHETEIFASMAIQEISDEPKELWDLCTGSGCLGIAVKKHRPEVRVTLSDISKQALVCAQTNAKNNGLKVVCMQSDLLSSFAGKKADYILCNPPYIAEHEYPYLESEIFFEPKEAFIAPEEGLEFYRRLALDLPLVLLSGAKVFFEIGHDQSKAIEQIFDQSHWKRKRCMKDWAGKDRFFFLEFLPDCI